MKTNLTTGWPSPILIGEMEDKVVADNTAQYILENYDYRNSPSEVEKKNILEDKNLSEFKTKIVDPCFDQWLKQVRNKSLDDFQKRSYTSWITGSNEGYSMLAHNHNGAQLSAVFYLINTDVDKGGEIVFYDPRGNANRSYKNADWGDFFEPLRVKVPSYTFAIFPSFIFHQVTTFRGHLRLAIPVDLYV